MEIYLVGGAVRDEKLGIPVSERDWCVVGSSETELKSKGFKSVGKDFPIFLHPETKEEYALARTERKTQPGYHGFTFCTSKDITLEDDLKRRDLTINAIAKDKHGQIIDPYNGLEDIKNKTLRHVSEAFKEDPVRVLRTAKFAARFHQIGFKVADSTIIFMQEMVKNSEIDTLAPDRIWKETKEILEGSDPHIFFNVLKDCHALSRVYPEFYHQLPNNKNKKLEQKSFLNLDALKLSSQLINDPAINFITVIFINNNILNKNYTKEKHLKLIKLITNRLPIPNNFLELAKLIFYFKDYSQLERMNAEDLLNFLEKTDAFRRRERFEKFLKACKFFKQYSETSKIECKIYERVIKMVDLCNDLPIREIVGNESNGEKIRSLIRHKRIDIIDKENARKIPK